MSAREIFDLTLYLLILINPMSKVFVLSVMSEQEEIAGSGKSELPSIVFRASLVALVILVLFTLGGHVLLNRVFHIEIYALQISGGIVLFLTGYKALSKGVFFEVDTNNRFQDLSIVPLASPMIAGPATITAAVSLTAVHRTLPIIVGLVLSLLLNYAIMRGAPLLSRFFRTFNIMGACIRITGLFVMAIASQMLLAGVDGWLDSRLVTEPSPPRLQSPLAEPAPAALCGTHNPPAAPCTPVRG